MAVLTNLYPPIVLDSMPAFIRTNICRVYFSLSSYTDITDIKNVQVTLVNANSNQSAFGEKYPTGIKITEIYTDRNRTDQFRYYINIEPSDLSEEIFGLNQIYKVQLRFTSVDATDIPSNAISSTGEQKIASWLNQNIDKFSEWSSVCLVKGISQPEITLRGFENNTPSQDEITLEFIPFLISGELSFENTEEKEYLQSYEIQIQDFQEIVSTAAFRSGIIYTNQQHPNEINYKIPYNFEDQQSYVLTITYTTNNLYSDEKIYYFTINTNKDALPVSITTIPNADNGNIRVRIASKLYNENAGVWKTQEQIEEDGDNILNWIAFSFEGTFVLKRTSSKSNFMLWDTIRTIDYLSPKPINSNLSDVSIESGVWYKYCIQEVLSDDRTFGPSSEISEATICVFDDIFLVNKKAQLRIQFNPTIGDFKYNRTESQQNTLGGKYPFIKLNGNNYYRSFNIGGLISSLSDQTYWYTNDLNSSSVLNQKSRFTSKEELYGSRGVPLYNQYNDLNDVSNYLDVIYERAFRQKVYDFLYGNDVKLFKSTTEGNILIKLTNISFQPNDTLGRALYSFTATATEIDEATMQNCVKYDVVKDRTQLELMTNARAASFNRNTGVVIEIEDYDNEAIILRDGETDEYALILAEVEINEKGRWK